MNASALTLEIAVACLGIGLLLLDLWLPVGRKRLTGWIAAAGILAVLIYSFTIDGSAVQHAFPGGPGKPGTFVLDPLALFFKQFFLAAAFLVVILTFEFVDRIPAGITEFYALILFGLTGMLLAASANDFILVFVSLELITASFYILISFQKSRLGSLEAGVKYLILGALSSAFLVFGIALVFGTANTTSFEEIRSGLRGFSANPIFLPGLLLVLVSLGFKIAAFPFQIWAPDVYEGAPVPATAFLAVGSKAAGFVLLLRMLYGAIPDVAQHWMPLLCLMAGATILYGNLCAIPQRNLKRLLGYSSIANAGYLLLGVAALSGAGSAALLYYLAGYLFAVIAAFTVIAIMTRGGGSEDVTVVAGLAQRSPLLAAALTMAMVSLAGIPPMAGFFGKFLLIKSVLEQAATNPAYYTLLWVAIAGVVISLFYYFGVIRAIYWSTEVPDFSPVPVSASATASLSVCMAGMLVLGIYPAPVVDQTADVARVLHQKPKPAAVQAAAARPEAK